MERMPKEDKCDIIGGFPYDASNYCNYCSEPLTVENAWMTDGCPCNAPLGINSMNETRWRLLMQLQQQQARDLEELKMFSWPKSWGEDQQHKHKPDSNPQAEWYEDPPMKTVVCNTASALHKSIEPSHHWEQYGCTAMDEMLSLQTTDWPPAWVEWL